MNLLGDVEKDDVESLDERVIDWEAIEGEYRAGILTLREIAKKHGIVHGSITKKAKKEHWSRDLSQKIRIKKDALLASKIEESSPASKMDALDTERKIVDFAADVQATVQIKQQGRIGRHQKLCDKLYAELDAQTSDVKGLCDLGDLIRENKLDTALDVYRRVISTPSRIDSFKKLTETLKTLIQLERQAYGINDNREDYEEESYEEMLKNRGR
jgi:hypothetical protein